VLRKRFLKPGTIGLIPTWGYTGNVNYSKKALKWLVHREQTDGCKILHGGNGREYRLPDVPNLSVDGFCVEAGKVYDFFSVSGNFTRACFSETSVRRLERRWPRDEQTMQKLEKITRAGYQVIVQWDCDFDREIVETSRTAHNPVVNRETLNTRDALYGGRTEAMRLQYKAREGKPSNTAMSCPYIHTYANI
jgi:hypothetical protein